MSSNASIRTVAERVGLTPHVLRAWERRYQILEPNRSKGGHRIYSEADIQRLSLIATAVRGGRPIRSVAKMPEEELRQILLESPEAETPPLSPILKQATSYRESILEAISQLHTRTLYDILDKAKVGLGWQGLLQLVIAPAAAEIGERWRNGFLSTAHEHLFSSAIKVFLGNMTRQYATSRSAPRLVIATPPGQLHELGALIATASAASVGWETAYLGTCLPASDIVGATVQFGAKALALSMVYPEDDPDLPSELSEIGRLLPKEIHILSGGRAAPAYTEALHSIGAQIHLTISDFCAALDAIRRPTERS
ncbi:MAG: hypothetical protein RLZZ399_1732 [Verrucomicrobiota bacterium]|jgi:DNA-binding transcriptional MerR regulator/methylmalonyl-CoA mutase cobalamin-binding subunit